MAENVLVVREIDLVFEDGEWFDANASNPEDPELMASIEVPTCWKICQRCEGEGRHDHPAFANGITQSEWQDEWDDESRENYMRGAYDVLCEDCSGSGKVRKPDLSRCVPALRKALKEWMRDQRIEAAERASEERWGY